MEVVAIAHAAVRNGGWVPLGIAAVLRDVDADVVPILGTCDERRTDRHRDLTSEDAGIHGDARAALKHAGVARTARDAHLPVLAAAAAARAEHLEAPDADVVRGADGSLGETG